MALDLVDYELKARQAVKAFWGNREAALANQAPIKRREMRQDAAAPS